MSVRSIGYEIRDINLCMQPYKTSAILTLYLYEMITAPPRWLILDTMVALGLGKIEDGRLVLLPEYELVELDSTQTYGSYGNHGKRKKHVKLDMAYDETKNSLTMTAVRRDIAKLLEELAKESEKDKVQT